MEERHKKGGEALIWEEGSWEEGRVSGRGEDTRNGVEDRFTGRGEEGETGKEVEKKREGKWNRKKGEG